MAYCSYFVPVLGQNGFIIFLILNQFSCGKVEIPCLLALRKA